MIYINKRPSYVITSKFPISLVISSRVKNNDPSVVEIYSNYSIENPGVSFYRKKTYEDGDLSLTGKTGSCLYDTYLYKDNISHGSTFYTEATSPIKYHLSTLGESRKVWELPSPVMLRTDLGKLIKFYLNKDFSNPVHVTNCVRYIRQSRGSDTSKHIYCDPWSAFTQVYNLKPGQTYLYKVYDANSLVITGIYKTNNSYGEFTTLGKIRQIRLMGTTNVRDSGGYLTVDGTKRVRYGKLFRGAQLQPGFFNEETLGAYNSAALRRWIEGVDSETDKVIGGLDDNAIQEFKNLGITAEIDLRDPGTTTSTDYDKNQHKDIRFFITNSSDGVTVNGNSVNDGITVNGESLNDGISYSSVAKISSSKNSVTYLGTDILSYYTMFTNNNSLAQDNGKRLFVVFIEEVIKGLEHRDANDNPRNDGAVYVHCMQGRDRTGTFMACLFALLGVNDDGIIKDYELTAVAQQGGTRWNLQYGTTEKSNGDPQPKALPTIPGGENIRTYVYNWATADSPTGLYITLAQIDKLKELLLEDIPEEPIASEPKKLTVLGGYNINSNLNDGTETFSVPAKNGTTITTEADQVTLTTLSSGSRETILGYSTLEGSNINNPILLTSDTIVTPKTIGNLFYNYRAKIRWVLDTTTETFQKTTNAGFYATEPFPVIHGLTLTFYFPGKANLSVSFEIIHTIVTGRLYAHGDLTLNQRLITLNLDSEGKADYLVEGQTGFTFCNFAISDTDGFTTFTAAEVKSIQVSYKNVSSWSVPTFKYEQVVADVSCTILSIVYYLNYLIAFHTYMETPTMVNLTDGTVRTISGSIKDTSIHANTAHLLPIKYDQSDYFPMILVGEENCKVVRLVGSDPATVTTAVICTWRILSEESSDFESNLASGNVLVVGNELYTIKASSSTGLWKAPDFDLSDINNYVNRLKGVNPIYAIKVADDICGGNLGQDCTSFSIGNKRYLIYTYGPLSPYWSGSVYVQRWSGLIISDFDTRKIISFLPLEGYGCVFSSLYNERAEPDGVAYAGNNTFYLAFNADSAAPIYKVTMAFPTDSFDWSKEKWVPMGDSLSDLTLTQANNKYQSYIGSLIPDLTILNTFANDAYRFANAGCGYYAGEESFYDVSKYVPSDATVITVFGSMNDRHYLNISDSTYTSKLSKVNSSSTGTDRITWILDPHLDTAADKTLAGYVADTLRRLHSYAPNAKVVVIPGLYYKNEDLTISLNTYFCYLAVVLALIDEENAGSWLSFESWYLDITLTKSTVDNHIRYTRSADSFIEDTKQIDKWLSSNLNQSFDSRKIANADFGQAYCYDYSTSTVYGHWNNDYHQRYLAVKFAHVLIKALGGTENDLPTQLKYNNI